MHPSQNQKHVWGWVIAVAMIALVVFIAFLLGAFENKEDRADRREFRAELIAMEKARQGLVMTKASDRLEARIVSLQSQTAVVESMEYFEYLKDRAASHDEHAEKALAQFHEFQELVNKLSPANVESHRDELGKFSKLSDALKSEAKSANEAFRVKTWIVIGAILLVLLILALTVATNGEFLFWLLFFWAME